MSLSATARPPLLAAELSLIEGKWRGSQIPSEELEQSPVLKIVKGVIEGNFREVLTNDVVRHHVYTQAAWNSFYRDSNTLPSFVSYLPETYATDAKDELDESSQELLRVAVGVACLHGFVQVNWTGPDLDITPTDILGPNSKEEDLNRQAISSFSFGGEPAYHLAKVATFLQIARSIFDAPHTHCRTAPWWKLRATIVHQHLLDEAVALPPSFFTPFEPLIEFLREDNPDASGRLILEQALLHHRLANDKKAAEEFVRAAKVMDLEYELTGALGRRTKFQQTDLSQLVLLARSRKRHDDQELANGRSEDPVVNNQPDEKPGDRSPTGGDSCRTDVANVPETILLNDDTLLEQTQFTSSSHEPSSSQALSQLDPGSQPPLHPLDQCIFLGLCLNVRNTNPSHGLTSEQMSPYVERVISHPRNWSVHTMALLLRSRLEASRTRTVERSTLQLQALIDQMPTSDSSLQERLFYFHNIPLPSKWELERELAIRFLSLGVVRSALEIFERLEMWEEVVKCWQSMERPEKGIAIVKDLLEGAKEEVDLVIAKGKQHDHIKRSSERMDAVRVAKLWCLLGDLEPEKALEHYQKAWEVSEQTSGRAMRSLGGYHFARGNFVEAIPCLNQAVAINPLLSRTWFVLGCALVREEKWGEARDAFSKCVAIDDEDGESWSNLASVYLRMGEAGKKAHDNGVVGDNDEEIIDHDAAKHIPFSNKMLAFRALKQGLKFGYENWRMWSNYMIVAVDVGELAEACRALGRLVEQRGEKVGDKCVDEDVLDRLVDAVTRTSQQAPVETHNPYVATQNPNEGQGLYNRVADLFDRVLLSRFSSSARIFRAHGRLMIWKSSWSAALESYLNAYRASVINDEKVDTDITRWREAVHEVEELMDMMRNLGPRIAEEEKASEASPEGKRHKSNSWQFRARGIIRTFMGRTKDAFEDEPEWTRLEDLLKELR